MNDLLKEEKEINAKLAKSSVTPEDSAILHSRLKVVYQELHDMEADKAEARYFLILTLELLPYFMVLGSLQSSSMLLLIPLVVGGECDWRWLVLFFADRICF